MSYKITKTLIFTIVYTKRDRRVKKEMPKIKEKNLYDFCLRVVLLNDNSLHSFCCHDNGRHSYW